MGSSMENVAYNILPHEAKNPARSKADKRVWAGK